MTVDQDTTDAFLDRDVPLYAGGRTFNVSRAMRGADTADLAKLADEHEERTGRPLPELPPLVDD